MALAAMRVPTVFTAKDKFSSVINTMTRNTRTFATGVSRLNSQINNEMASINRMAKYAAIAGGTMLFYKAGEDIIAYEKAIASLGAVTGTVVGSMNKDIESLGKETKRSVIDIAASFENIGSKMSEYLKNPTALREIAKQSILLADASRMPIEESTDNLTSILNQFKLTYKDANRVVNKLSAGEDIGASTISESADVVRQFAASSRMAGASLEETIALVQNTTKTLGKQGVGRGFRNLMVDLNTGKGMDKNKQKALLMVGADINKIIKPTTKFVDKLREIKKLLSNKQAMGMFFKKTGFETGATFLGSFDQFEQYLKFIEEKNTAQIKADKNNATFAKGWMDLKNAFTNVVVTGENAGSSLDFVKGIMASMIPNMGNLVNLISSVAIAFVGWKIIVGIVSLVSGIMSAFRAIMSVHRFVVLWATLTNTGYAASLWAVAAATLAAYWPLLLIAGALGLLVYAFWDTGDAADDMVSKQVAALSKGDAAMINSTDVMARELAKQKKLMETPKIENPASKEAIKMNQILGEESKRRSLVSAFRAGKDMSGKQMLPKIDQSLAKKLYENNQMETVLGKDKATTLRNQGFTFQEFKKVYPNVAGYENRPNQETKGEITITLKGDTGNISDISGSGGFVFKGIPAKTASTTGVKNQ